MYGIKTENTEGRLVNEEGELIYYSGEENFPKVMREFCDAMVKRDLAKIMPTSSAREPLRIPLEEENQHSFEQVNRNRQTVEKWESDCQKAITFFKSIFSAEIRQFIRDISDPITENSKERFQYIRERVEKTYNAVTPEKLRSIRNKISNLNYVYDSTGLHNNVRIIREAQEQLSAWSNLTPGADYVDYREREDFLKSNLLTSVEQWKALELMAYTMKKSPHLNYETVKSNLIKEARDVEDSVRNRTSSRQNSNPMMSASSASSIDLDEQYAYSASAAGYSAGGKGRKCYNCDGQGHMWQTCTVKMADCFICKQIFDKYKPYHHPSNCPARKSERPTTNEMGLKVRAISQSASELQNRSQGNDRFTRDMSRMGPGEKRHITSELEINNSSKKQLKASSAWTPTHGGVLWNNELSRYEYFKPQEILSANLGVEDELYGEVDFNDEKDTPRDNGYST
jgi:hypothetical protein